MDNPYLSIDSISRYTIESLDVHMLLDPLEEDLNLPPFPVKLYNGN